jgi:glycosyltransferase involved in cell wall biosynthesis
LRLLALIPAYNEAASIARLVEATRPYVEAVLVVDDGSRDATAELARQAGATVLVQPVNGGKGAALQRGFDYCLEQGFEAVVTLDADGQHDPALIPALVAPLAEGTADLVVGSRRQLWDRHMPLVRRLTNAFMSWLLSRVAGQRLEDTQSGYRVLHARVLRQVRPRTSRFEAESEFLLVAARRGFRIAWVPISVIYGGRPSHVRPLADGLRFARMLVRVLLGRP